MEGAYGSVISEVFDDYSKSAVLCAASRKDATQLKRREQRREASVHSQGWGTWRPIEKKGGSQTRLQVANDQLRRKKGGRKENGVCS